ncbi:MAG: ABC transporter ATP-binding protein [Oligoflexales bacterium]|nr:ABC transporter ATP-binding protein [Oligoflexales bacterium]
MTQLYSEVKKSNTWSIQALDSALNNLVSKSKKIRKTARFSTPPQLDDVNELGKVDLWLNINSEQIGLMAIHHKWHGDKFEEMLADLNAGFLRVVIEGEYRFLIVIERSAKFFTIVNQDSTIGNIKYETLLNCFIQSNISLQKVDPIRLNFDGKLDPKIKSFIENKIQYATVESLDFTGLWTIELAPDQSLMAHFIVNGMHIYLIKIFFISVANYLLFVLTLDAFSQLISGTLVEDGRVFAWGMLLFTAIPLNTFLVYKFGNMGLVFAVYFRQFLLAKVLNIPRAEVRQKGIGGFLGAMAEADKVDVTVIQGANYLIVGAIQITILLTLIFMHPVLWYFGIALAIWISIMFYYNYRFYVNSLVWAFQRLNISSSIFEKMQGLLTERLQRDKRDIEKEDDLSMSNYYNVSKQYDNASIRNEFLIDAAWTPLSCLLLLPLIFIDEANTSTFVTGVGFVILSSIVIMLLIEGLGFIGEALVAYRQIEKVVGGFSAKQIKQTTSFVESVVAVADGSDQPEILKIRDLDFRYKDQNRLVLDGCNFSVKLNDKILLGGKSGGGKSTLAKIMNLENDPLHGSVVLNGLDRSAWHNFQWRKKVVYIPQFHNNHIFSGSVAFNLLIARQWPAQKSDLVRMRSICSDLGLDDVLRSMPQGIWQLLGESGWQLSHGEKSRFYIARGILQDPDILILDESLASVDPDTADMVLSAIDKYTKTCIMIAHA